MSILDKTVMLRWSPFIKKYYESKGYKWTKQGDYFEVLVKDLLNNSKVLINVICDCCGEQSHIEWRQYIYITKMHNKYYCKKCKKVFRKSFYDWCLEHNRFDILLRWDFELNMCSPQNINYGTHTQYYFKCPRGIHPSELKNIHNFIQQYKKKHEGVMDCAKCNSFAQWGIDNICKDFLEKYWDYNKNNKLNISPWNIPKYWNKYIHIFCQEKKYHDSYYIRCADFVKGDRCPYCHSRQIHPLDSLGKLLEDKGLLEIWSKKNDKSPYTYAVNSHTKVWWKCFDKMHNDYKRSPNSAIKLNFRCPECGYSKGEAKISEYLINNQFIKIMQEEYNKLNIKDKINNKYYISQKEFDGLVGLGNGNLSYDFYLPNYNLLIEYQGGQHEEYVSWMHKLKKNFKKQQEHDRRKREYASNNKIKLLEIWYNCYDDIEFILDEVLTSILKRGYII